MATGTGESLSDPPLDPPSANTAVVIIAPNAAAAMPVKKAFILGTSQLMNFLIPISADEFLTAIGNAGVSDDAVTNSVKLNVSLTVQSDS
jgi:hypothetical protein